MTATHARSSTRTFGSGVFYAVRAEAAAVTRDSWDDSEKSMKLVSEWIMLAAGSWGTGTVREPRGRGTSPVGSRYQKTGEDTADWEGLSVCCSELQSVWIGDSAVVTCGYELCVFFFLWHYSPNLDLGLPPWNSPFHFSFLHLRQSVGLLGRVISSSQGLYLYTNTEKYTHIHKH
jgi:hypothetical protein